MNQSSVEWRRVMKMHQEERGERDRLREKSGARVSRWDLLLEEIVEGLSGIHMAGRSCGRRGAGGGRLSIRSGRGILFNGHAEFVERAGIFGIFRRDALLDGLGAFELRAGIEEAALLAAMQFELAFGARAIGIEAGSEDGAAIRTSRAGDRADHARRARAKLIGAAGTASRWLAVVSLTLLIVFFRVPITAVAVLAIHKRLRPPVSTDCYNYNSCFCAVALPNLACIQSDCYTRPDCAIIP